MVSPCLTGRGGSYQLLNDAQQAQQNHNENKYDEDTDDAVGSAHGCVLSVMYVEDVVYV